MNRCLRLSVLLTGLFAVTLLVGGCNSSIDSRDMRRDWTPELHSTAATYDQYWNERTIYRTNMKRQIKDDWANIWFEGRNMRMSRYPMP